MGNRTRGVGGSKSGGEGKVEEDGGGEEGIEVMVWGIIIIPTFFNFYFFSFKHATSRTLYVRV